MADKTAQDILLQLKAKGIPMSEVSTLIGYSASSLCKVARGEHNDLPYSVGKRLEKLQGMKKVNPYKVGRVK